MTRGGRVALLVVAILLGLLVAWRIVTTRVAERRARSAPHAALHVNAHDPEALLVLAREQLAAQQWQAAADTARRVLQVSPLKAEALVVLARVADAQGAPTTRNAFEIALSRAPRNAYARAWLIGDQLQHAEYKPALANIDKMLVMTPARADVLMPVMLRLADQPKFATALTQTLASRPPWRSDLLDRILREGSYQAAEAVYGQLLQAGDLQAGEADAWFRRLGQAGLWGEARQRWATWRDVPPGADPPLLHNGGFEQDFGGVGFDWRVANLPGVRTRRVVLHGNRIAEVDFLGRRTPVIPFAQTLVLAPGTYRLRFRASGQSLRSDVGLAWSVRCHDPHLALGTSAPLEGSFEWETFEFRFSVPPTHCVAQVLELVNPGAEGVGKIVAGTLRFDDFSILHDASVQPPSG